MIAAESRLVIGSIKEITLKLSVVLYNCYTGLYIGWSVSLSCKQIPSTSGIFLPISLLAAMLSGSCFGNSDHPWLVIIQLASYC